MPKDLEHSGYIRSIQQVTVSMLMRNNWGLALFYKVNLPKYGANTAWIGPDLSNKRLRVGLQALVRSDPTKALSVAVKISTRMWGYCSCLYCSYILEQALNIELSPL